MNKRILILLAGFLIGCSQSETPADRTTPAAPSAAAVKIIAFGDSLTAGKDLADPELEAWPAILEGKLREEKYSVEVVNAGQSGDTTYDALNRLDFALSQGGDVVIVAFGSNDTFQGKDLKDIEKNLDEIIRRIKDRKVDVVLCGMKTFPNFGWHYAGAYEKIFPRVAKRWDVPFVPFLLEGVAGKAEFNLSDGIHPNAKGHAVLADNIFPTMEKALNAKRR